MKLNPSRRFFSAIITALVMLMLAPVSSCRTVQSNTPRPLKLLSNLNMYVVGVGEEVEVECVMLDDKENPVEGPTEVQVVPTDGIRVDGAVLVPSRTGSYTISCTSVEHDDLALHSAILTVRPAGMGADAAKASLEEGAPVRVQAVLARPQVKVNEKVEVDCVAINFEGAVIEDAPTELETSRRVDVVGSRASSRIAGHHDIHCRVPSHSGIVSVPATLTVHSGEPVRIRIKVEPELNVYPQASTVTVIPTLRDQFGNLVPGTDVRLQWDGAERVEPVADAPNRFTLKETGEVVFHAIATDRGAASESGEGGDGDSVDLVAQQTIRIGREALSRHGKAPDLDVPYVPTPQSVVDEMIRMARITPEDLVYDLGCGDGRQIITAASKYGTRGIGVDLDPVRIKESRENARKADVEHLLEFRVADLFETDFREADVLLMYLLPRVNLELRPKILAELSPGSRIVSHDFDMGDWKPDKHQTMDTSRFGHEIYMWTVPARVAGRWTMHHERINGGEQLTVDLLQHFQRLGGHINLGDDERAAISSPGIKGRQISFHAEIQTPDRGGMRRIEFEGEARDEDRIEGTLMTADGEGEQRVKAVVLNRVM